MPRASKIGPCVDCQEPFPRKLLNRMGRCHDCAWKAVMDAARQLHNHEGPYYEKWKAAMRAHAKFFMAEDREVIDEATQGKS